MLRPISFTLLFLGTTLGLTAQAPATFSVANPLPVPRPDATLVLTATDVRGHLGLDPTRGLRFTHDGRDVPFQPVDRDRDGVPEAFTLLLDLKAGEKQTIAVRHLAVGEAAPTFPRRTQAEVSHKVDGRWQDREYQGGSFVNVDSLAVPPEHTDHSWFIRYEGPGWESDLVGYRFYLDWRNATDVFGKKTTDLTLQDVGQDGFDSYHEASDWGMDVLKVGKALGVGSLATWHDGRALRVEETDSVSATIVASGPVESMVRTRYHGWRVGPRVSDVTSELSIAAGSRLTRHDVSLSAPLPNLATGIVKLEQGEVLQGEAGQWAYLATWGPQSLAGDLLGLAVVYRTADRQLVTEDNHSHVVVLTPHDQQLTYYFLATWEQDTRPIRTREAFVAYLNDQLQRLNSPLAPSFSRR
ncbi:hypothetical protein GGR26_000737 [Lewinella marina]|uniref:DUF4861 domain-containing protein n=1 Tax=Neolewinella marina TaxID=438751 RepID=A0A2G0CIT1_9BACT|nr:DUF4861 domain-containing protein [Neolewinella marina]NJB84992.1 hypothetical protein [Neolewinella marina]PHK99858.1 DUF4861 domain-containing protein [Neolewinella marina]